MGGFSPGTCVRLVCDNQGAVATANGASVCVSTAPYARRLAAAAWAAGVAVQVEWAPRALLDAEDAASRWTDGSLAFARPSFGQLRRLWASAWGATPIRFELFACEADRVAPSVPFASRLHVPGSVGEAMSLDWARLPQPIWAYPPFSLVRPLLAKLAACSAPPLMSILLPDTQLVRQALRGWRVSPGPGHIFGPPDFATPSRSPAPLCLFSSPD